jgi:hypothetical protein
LSGPRHRALGPLVRDPGKLTIPSQGRYQRLFAWPHVGDLVSLPSPAQADFSKLYRLSTVARHELSSRSNLPKNKSLRISARLRGHRFRSKELRNNTTNLLVLFCEFTVIGSILDALNNLRLKFVAVMTASGLGLCLWPQALSPKALVVSLQDSSTDVSQTLFQPNTSPAKYSSTLGAEGFFLLPCVGLILLEVELLCWSDIVFCLWFGYVVLSVSQCKSALDSDIYGRC